MRINRIHFPDDRLAGKTLHEGNVVRVALLLKFVEPKKVHGIAEVIIGKQRHGPTGTVRLWFEDRLTRFSNLAHEYHVPATYR